VVLDVRGLSVRFAVERGAWRRRAGWVRAVDDVSLRVAPRETLALVGESGSGKTTVGRAILRLVEAQAGQVLIGGPDDAQDWRQLEGEALRRERWRAQVVFQDPASSLSPRRTVRELVDGPRHLYPARAVEPVEALLARVGLGKDVLPRAPSTLSGGQRQRVALARALATGPQLIVLDEALSALDASVAAQILNLLAELRAERGLSYVFIAHDLAAVRWLADRVAVMYLGRLVETASRAALFEAPRHPYTRALLASVPSLDAPTVPAVLPGEPPSPLAPPSGCAFHPRCALATERCRGERPVLRAMEAGHEVACHHA
jgi:oligopeptide/dipeptide ABC transporter ATP-binding protein